MLLDGRQALNLKSIFIINIGEILLSFIALKKDITADCSTPKYRALQSVQTISCISKHFGA
jgi:hypothetical protein